jgi:ABC-type Fe3+/spermidine/putrescine transport system ATPase subunit
MAEKRKLALRLHGVTKTYDAVTAIRSLTFDVEEGRFFVLFGPSSVGKTTTLRTIAGLVVPDSGRLEIGGVDMIARGRDTARRDGQARAGNGGNAEAHASAEKQTRHAIWR